jgi:hypothetical protein
MFERAITTTVLVLLGCLVLIVFSSGDLGGKLELIVPILFSLIRLFRIWSASNPRANDPVALGSCIKQGSSAAGPTTGPPRPLRKTPIGSAVEKVRRAALKTATTF